MNKKGVIVEEMSFPADMSAVMKNVVFVMDTTGREADLSRKNIVDDIHKLHCLKS